MPELLEDELSRIFSDAGSDLETPADLADRAESRYRGRRRRRTGLATVTIVAALAVVGLTLTHRGGATPATTAAPSPGSTAGPSASGPPKPMQFPTDTSGLKAPEKVWPGQVGFVPSDAPGGGTYRVVARLDAARVLVTWEASLQRPEKLFAYNLRTASATLVADLHGPAGVTDYFPQEVTTNAGSIFWWAMGMASGEATTYLWTVPKTGGTPKLVGTLAFLNPDRGHDLSDLVATETDLYWSDHRGGVYTVPVGGGAVQGVPGLEAFRFIGFPWATAVDPASILPDPAGTESYSEGPSVATRLRNVLTGEEIKIKARGNAVSLWCQPTFCFGTLRDGTPYVARPDGTGTKSLPGFSYGEDQVLANHIAVGYVSDSKHLVLVDVTGGKAAVLTTEGASPATSGLIFWMEDGGYGVLLADS